VSEAAAKYNVKLPPGLADIKLPAAPADLNKYETLIKSALTKLTPNMTDTLAKATPPLEGVVKALNTANEIAGVIPKDKMPNVEQVMGAVNSAASAIKSAAAAAKQSGLGAPAAGPAGPTAA
jgi:hypothetical protein